MKVPSNLPRSYATIYVVVEPCLFGKKIPMTPYNAERQISHNDYRNEKVIADELRKIADDIERGCGFVGCKFKYERK